MLFKAAVFVAARCTCRHTAAVAGAVAAAAAACTVYIVAGAVKAIVPLCTCTTVAESSCIRADEPAVADRPRAAERTVTFR